MSIAALQNSGPETAIVLGSGLGPVADEFEFESEIPYAEVPGLSASKVPGHAGRFIMARHRGKPLLIAQGRRHLYEGLTAAKVTAPIRFMRRLGVKRVILTNAAGAIRSDLEVGGLMLITDHLNLQGTSPLVGSATFADMSVVYSRSWREKFAAGAKSVGLKLHTGVYAAVLGPQYETPAEVRMLRTLGADAVGMSTVPEAIQARALGMKVVGISMLTNWAAGLKPQKLNHVEVVAAGEKVSEDLARLLKAVL